MDERIIRVVERRQVGRFEFAIVETMYEFGRHYVCLMDGEPGFHSVDLERVQNYVQDLADRVSVRV